MEAGAGAVHAGGDGAGEYDGDGVGADEGRRGGDGIGKKASEVKGVKLVHSEKGAAVYEVESGTYTFKSTL